jgi:hypothetical protein
MLFRHGKASLTERVFDQGVGGDVDLPIVLVVAERTDRQHGSGKREGQDLDAGRGVRHYVGNLRQSCLQERDRFHNLDAKGDQQRNADIDLVARPRSG